jgi:hypothetical protein
MRFLAYQVSGKSDSNRQQRVWKTRTLPLSYFRRGLDLLRVMDSHHRSSGYEPDELLLLQPAMIR